MVTFLVISDENEKLEARCISNGEIVLHCMTRERVMPREVASFGIALALLVPAYLVERSRSLLRSLLICCGLQG